QRVRHPGARAVLDPGPGVPGRMLAPVPREPDAGPAPRGAVPRAPGERSPMSAPVDVSVVLSTYNRAARLAGALDALLDQEAGAAYEVIVVDNNSTDATK